MPQPIIFALVVVGLLALGALIFWQAKKPSAIPLSRFEKHIGRLLLQLAKENDFLCLNHLSIKVDDFFIHVPSILIGNKYFYYIDPLVIKGVINGKDVDRKWILNSGKESKHFDNPIKKNDLIIQVVADLVKVDVKDFINVSVLNTGVKMGDISIIRNNAAVVREKELLRFIKTMEKEADVNVYKPEDVEFIASQLYDIHRKSVALKRRQKKR